MKTQNAFTMTELMITLAIAAILATVALPNMQFLIANNKITTKTNELIRVFSYAKSESILNPTQTIVIEPITSITTDEWGAGWKIGIDADGDNLLSDAEVLKFFEFEDNIIVDQLVYTNPILFERGRVKRMSCDSTCVFIVCNEKHSLKQEITLRRIGKARTKSCDNNNSCHSACS
ncbi:MAG: GspH/FimT family pseudopilin [Thiomargarita sp.]|nr:GspH/FimT family pseudopilin [Thiomargarita sp.]